MHACAEMLLGDPRDLQSLKMELLLTLLLFSIPSKTDLIATPQYSSQRSDLFGSCGHLEISQLGSFGEPSISGLVPSNLQHSAQERSQGDPLYTMDYPLVRINSAVITCESRSTMRIGYGTVSVIVEFTCRGVACQQFQVRNRTYSHLFSFVCRPGGAIYETQMSIDGFRASINRDTTNSVSNTVTASDDSCMLCTNDISVQTDSRFQQETGCLECRPSCFDVGLRSCVTNIEGGDTTCCSWWHKDTCVSSCPPPYFISDSDTNECNAIAHLKASDDLTTGDHCYGDTLTYNCSSTVPNIFVNLIWTISYPGLNPVTITYGSNSPLNIREKSMMGISSILTRYTRNLYMESLVMLTVLRNISMNEIQVSCAVSNILPANLDIQYSLLLQVPSIQLLIVEIFPTTLNTAIVTLCVRQKEFKQSRAQRFQLSISPQPLLSSFDSKDIGPFNVTVRISTIYNASITATNCIGSSSSFVLIETVFGPRPHISEERTGVVVISNINIDLGTSGANISCSTYSVLPTQLTWSSSFEGNSIPSGIIPTTLGRQVLNLIWTRPSLYADSGEYKCTATNARGSNTATVAVLVSIPTSLLAIHPNNGFDFGSTATVLIPLGFNREVFTCIASGMPPLSVEWLKDGIKDPTRFTSENSYIMENVPFVSSVLSFPYGFNTTDNGVYMCVVQDNTDTFQSESITLEHTSNPKPVIDPVNMCQVNTTIVYFLIRILDTPCKEWNADQKQNIMANVFRILVGVVTTQCLDCILSEDTLVLTDGPTCSEMTKNVAVFRGNISTQKSNLTKTIFCALNNWLVTGPVVQLLSSKNYVLDTGCLFKLSSPTSPECSNRITKISYNLLAYSSGVILCVLIIVMAAVASAMAQLIRKRKEDKASKNEIDIDGVIDLEDIINRRSMYGNTMEYQGNAHEAMLRSRRESLYEGSVHYEDIFRYNDGQASGTEDESEYPITLCASSEFTAEPETRVRHRNKDGKRSRSHSDHGLKSNRFRIRGSKDRTRSYNFMRRRVKRSHSFDTSRNYEDEHNDSDGRDESKRNRGMKRGIFHQIRRNSQEDRGRSDNRNSRDRSDKMNSQEDRGRNSREERGRSSQGNKRNSQEDRGKINSQEDRGRSNSRENRGREDRDKRDSREDRDRSDRREDRNRSHDKRNSREGKDRCDKRNSRGDRDRSDKRNSRDRERGDKRNSREDRDRSDKRNSREDRDRRDKRNSREDRDRSDKRNSREDRDRSDKRNSREDRDRSDKRNSSQDRDRSDKRNYHDDRDKSSYGDRGSNDKRNSQEDRARSQRENKSALISAQGSKSLQVGGDAQKSNDSAEGHSQQKMLFSTPEVKDSAQGNSAHDQRSNQKTTTSENPQAEDKFKTDDVKPGNNTKNGMHDSAMCSTAQKNISPSSSYSECSETTHQVLAEQDPS